MGGFIAWLSAHPDVIGIAAIVVVSVVARYAPHTPFWDGVRAIAVDYANRNAKSIPADVGARLEGTDIVLTVGGVEVKRVPAMPRGEK